MLLYRGCGITGPAVRAWQRIVGVHYDRVDGIPGDEFDAHVKAWQEAHGVEPDGVVGPLTRAAVPLAALIVPFEGLVLYAYDDHDGWNPMARLHREGNEWVRKSGGGIIGNPTIGYGRLLHYGDWIETCTREEATRWLSEAVRHTYGAAAEKLVDGDAAQKAAATSFAYNNGTGALAHLAATGFAEVQWVSYIHDKDGKVVPGLPGRRAEEYAVYAGASQA